MNENQKSIGVEFRQVTKRFGAKSAPLVIGGVDLLIKKGSLTTILGPSGCGKTTLLRMIAGLETPSSGRILIDGEDVTELGPAQRNVSMVFQSYALFPHMNVFENVAYGLTVAAVPALQRTKRVQAALEMVGLIGYEQRSPSELSGGQQQRVAVARALVLEPSVMLFDEPLSNLDARLRRSMRDEIRQLQQRLGLTVAYVTHDQGEALAVSDQVIVMDQGRVAQAGSPTELFEHPANSLVARFMGEAVIFKGQADGSRQIRIADFSVSTGSVCAPGPVDVAVRPSAWVISGSGAESGAQSVAQSVAGLAGKISALAYLGGYQEVTVQTRVGAILVIDGNLDRPLQVGQAVVLNAAGRGVSVLAEV
jgi:iron(III) transport system ATP-binding protein